MNPITLSDVARAAGVTQMTVSRVFSGKAPVATRTRHRVIEAAAQLGYRPSAAARATRTGRTDFIGMIRSPVFAHSVHEPALDAGIDEALLQRGLCLVRDVIDANGRVAPRIVRENAVDGLLINYAFGTPPPVRELLNRCRIPAIWINRKRDANCVHPNDEGAAFEATCYLIAHGHRRIGYVSEIIDPASIGEIHYSETDRYQGYKRAMTSAGLQPERWGIPKASGDMDGSAIGHFVRCFADLLRRPDRPTALLCMNGGREMVAAAWKMGLRVPEDVSVMTFDNHAAADIGLGVDRVLVRYHAMGRAAVEELCALIDEPDVPRRPVRIPFEFHQTGSVARPAS